MGKYSAGGKKRTGLILLCCVLAVALASVLAVTIVVNRLLDKVQRPEDTTLSSSQIQEILGSNTTEGTPAGETTDMPTQTTDSTTPTEDLQKEEQIHVLLIGHTSDSASGWQNAEAMILCSVDKSTKTLTATSFVRDTDVQIPGYGRNELHVAYSIGGMKLLGQCLEENFGVSVDANIAVNINGLMQLVDMAGGVPVELTAWEASYLHIHGNSGVTSMGGWNLKAGANILTGEQAVGYVMIRDAEGEALRTLRQRNVIAALVQQAKKLSVGELYDLVEEGLRWVCTDMTNSEILDYAAELAPLLKDLKLVTQRIPAE